MTDVLNKKLSKSRYIDYISDSNYDCIPKTVESNNLNNFSFFFTDAETTYSLRTILNDCLVDSNIDFVMLDEFKFRCSYTLYYGVMGFDICIYTSTEEQKVIKEKDSRVLGNGPYIVDFCKRYGDSLAFCNISNCIRNKLLNIVQTSGKSMFDNSRPVIASDEFRPDYILYFLKSSNDCQGMSSLNIPDTPKFFSEYEYSVIWKKFSKSLNIPKLIL